MLMLAYDTELPIRRNEDVVAGWGGVGRYTGSEGMKSDRDIGGTGSERDEQGGRWTKQENNTECVIDPP